MIELFKFLSNLERTEGISLFISLCLFLFLIPYYSLIIKYFKYIVLKKELKIISFDYSTLPLKYEDFINNLNSKKNNFLIINTPIYFTWKVEGAKKIDILPLYKNAKGNTAKSIIKENVKMYKLVAHGFNGKSVESIIDLSGELFYKINTNPLASNQKIIRQNPLIHSTNFSFTNINTFNKTNLKIRNLNYWKRNDLPNIKKRKLNLSYFSNNNHKNERLGEILNESKILKSYTFSTKKFQNINI
jgi:hypothetical protein